MSAEKSDVLDVIIVGAGISGINAGYRVQSELPGSKYAILEARGGIGGTWDFFRYPGIRSDSDLHTFGFPWRPWDQLRAIADGASIRQYINKTAADEGIDKHVRFHHKVVSADWSSEHQFWTLICDVQGEEKIVRGKFVVLGTGYYSYDKPLATKIAGLENFKGTIVHPQFWPEDLDYDGKKMVVIGSGATAVTLLPSLAEKASHVTMVQRSPGYLITRPAVDPTARWARAWLPKNVATTIVRWKFLLLPWIFFNFCRAWPSLARRALKRRTKAQLPKNVPHNPHFEPVYNPWEQRLCLCPDGDFFAALRSGKTDIATGTIETCTENAVVLSNGQKLEADIVITATGLNIQMAGGAALSIDGKPLNLGEKYLWKGVLVQDVPNAGCCIGYTNASWTLGADACSLLITRLLKTMKEQGVSVMIPRVPKELDLTPQPILNLNSTYVMRALDKLPKAGDSGPWKAKVNYFRDYWNAKYGDIKESLEFIKPVSS